MELQKINLTKSDPIYYKVGKSPVIVDLPECRYLAIQGQSSPEDPSFIRAIEALYTAAYGIKFICKAEDLDFVVPKMESFWFVAGGLNNQRTFTSTPRNQWHWKVMIRMPEFVDPSYLRRAIIFAQSKKDNAALVENIAFELIPGGKFGQILHKGSYEEEEPSVLFLFDFLSKNGFEPNGYHREIYLKDPNKVPAEKLETILRYSVKQSKS